MKVDTVKHSVETIIAALSHDYATKAERHASDMIRDQAARIKQLEAAIKRQASASTTLRRITLDEVQHLKDKDRSEYIAAQTVESEREANAILTDRVEQLEAALASVAEIVGRYDEESTCASCTDTTSMNEEITAIIAKEAQ